MSYIQFAVEPEDPPAPRLKGGYKFENRLKIHRSLSTFSGWSTICDILNKVPKDDKRKLAHALNDLPERARKRALGQLKANFPSTYSTCINIISEFQIEKDRLDPRHVFP